MDENIMMKWLEKRLSQKRFTHSIGVKNVAVELAKKYGANEEKALTAGLLHDCAKNLNSNELLKYVENYEIDCDPIKLRQPELLHADVGAEIAKREFDIDEETIKAIKYHTLGCNSMDLLTKIIFISDYIEPSRTFKEVDILRKLTFENLDASVIVGMEWTVRHVMSKNILIHTDIINARNNILIQKPELSDILKEIKLELS